MRMMNRLHFILIIMIATLDTTAQTLEGLYRLQQGPEMAAEFHFTKEGRFEFGFAYGAVDRMAEGTYTVKDGKVTLHSEKVAGKDFTVKAKKRQGEGFTVKISDANAYLTHHVLCLFKKGDHYDQQYSDDQGIVHSKLTDCDSIFVMSTLFPDAMTLVKDDFDKTNNYFELTLNPSLAQVSFKSVTPRIDKDCIVLEMPFLFERAQAVFVKVVGE